MELKKLYHRVTNDAGEVMHELARDDKGEPIIDPVTHVAKMKVKIMRDANGAPIVRGVEVRRLPKNGTHKFTDRTIATGIAEGWLTKSDQAITIHEAGEAGTIDHVFSIIDKPGRTCLHCRQDLPGITEDPTGYRAREHIRNDHGGKGTPDNTRWPNGYAVRNYYLTTLEQ